jgi:hypothetical protein
VDRECAALEEAGEHLASSVRIVGDDGLELELALDELVGEGEANGRSGCLDDGVDLALLVLGLAFVPLECVGDRRRLVPLGHELNEVGEAVVGLGECRASFVEISIELAIESAEPLSDLLAEELDGLGVREPSAECAEDRRPSNVFSKGATVRARAALSRGGALVVVSAAATGDYAPPRCGFTRPPLLALGR